MLDLIREFGIKKGFSRISLQCRKYNFPALGLYKKFGFVEENDDNAGEIILMTLDLQKGRMSGR